MRTAIRLALNAPECGCVEAYEMRRPNDALRFEYKTCKKGQPEHAAMNRSLRNVIPKTKK